MPETNGFRAIQNSMRGGGGGGGFMGMLAEQRRMNFEMGMAQLNHQYREIEANNDSARRTAEQKKERKWKSKERDKDRSHEVTMTGVNHSNAKDMATHKAGIDSAASSQTHVQDKDMVTHKAQTATDQGWVAVDQKKKQDQNSATVRLSEEARRRKLPLGREETYRAKQQRDKDARDAAAQKVELDTKVKLADLQVERSRLVNQREEAERQESKAMNSQMMPVVMDMFKNMVGGGTGGSSLQDVLPRSSGRRLSPSSSSSGGAPKSGSRKLRQARNKT